MPRSRLTLEECGGARCAASCTRFAHEARLAPHTRAPPLRTSTASSAPLSPLKQVDALEMRRRAARRRAARRRAARLRARGSQRRDGRRSTRLPGPDSRPTIENAKKKWGRVRSSHPRPCALEPPPAARSVFFWLFHHDGEGVFGIAAEGLVVRGVGDISPPPLPVDVGGPEQRGARFQPTLPNRHAAATRSCPRRLLPLERALLAGRDSR